MTRRWVLGRAEGCDIRVDDEYASPRHCRIVAAENGLVTVEDLGSTNGTRLRPPGAGRHGGVRVLGPTPIQVGDIIQIGRTDITWTGSVGESVEVTP
jgi:pSer/pThr/pTyr-binding forkhead associated (FHA) protein